MTAKIKKEIPYLMFIIPAFIVYTVLTVYPLIQTLGLSFTNWDGYSMDNLKFIGLENYRDLFGDRAMKSALINTCFYSIVFPVIVTILAIPLSLALNSKMKTRNFQRAVFFFPSVPSAIILGYLWTYILAPTSTGILNKALGIFGIKPVLWLANPKWAMFSVIFVGVWSAVGWHACIYLAQLQSIPQEYYEAAVVDGASPWQKFRYITFPMLSSAMTVSVLLLLVNAMKMFDLPFALTNGGPGTSTTMISQIIIKSGFVEKNYGKATAMSAVFFIFITIVSIVQLTSMKRREIDT
ncbi:MAG: sugar ABC transporter permease [Clostridiales bacterium]|nr:sugar ABC transporter permease [Clostridiales bacterium]